VQTFLVIHLVDELPYRRLRLTHITILIAIHLFVLQCLDEALGKSVVIGIAGSAHAATNVPVKIIPISFNFAGAIISPANVPCGDTTNAITRVQDSPLFTSTPLNEPSVGTTQFTDVFQRANFWNFVSTVSPNYHVMLQPVSTLANIVIDVPSTIAASSLSNLICPAERILTIPISFMNTVITQILQTGQISPDTLPVFLTYNTIFTTPQGLALGYHTSFGNQTVVVASYLGLGFSSPGNVDDDSDVRLLSHELAEWMNDPFGNDVLPFPWDVAGAPPCNQQNEVLEVGDPLFDRVSVPYLSPGFTYHIQELAYLSWFLNQSPSLAISGKYSTKGTFTQGAFACP
jgi:hypothetical protein